MDIKIVPSVLSGEVNIPPSKSAAHRALICAALSEEISRVTPYCTSKDIKATVSCLKALGMSIEEDENGDEILASIDNDEEYEKIGGMFLARLNEMYDED